MIWRYFHKIGPHSVGGNRRVDSRNIAASIVPFLRLPHPQDIYNFIVGGSLCWGIVEMNSAKQKLLKLAGLAGNNKTTSQKFNINKPPSNFNINGLKKTIRNRAASDPTPLRNNPNNTTRKRAMSDPTPRSNRNTTLNFYKSYNLKNKNGISQRNNNKKLISGINSKKKRLHNNTYATKYANYKTYVKPDKKAIQLAKNNALNAMRQYQLTPNEVNATNRYKKYDKLFMTDPVRAFNDVLNALSEFNIILIRVGKGDISNEIQNLKNKYSQLNMLTTNNSYSTLCNDIIKLIEKIYPMLYNETTSITSALVGDEADLRVAFGKVYLYFTQKFTCRDMINKSNTLKKLAQEF